MEKYGSAREEGPGFSNGGQRKEINAHKRSIRTDRLPRVAAEAAVPLLAGVSTKLL